MRWQAFPAAVWALFRVGSTPDQPGPVEGLRTINRPRAPLIFHLRQRRPSPLAMAVLAAASGQA